MRIFFASKKKLLVEAVSAIVKEQFPDCEIWGVLDVLRDEQPVVAFRGADIIILTEPGFDCSTLASLKKLNFIAPGVPIVLISCSEEIHSVEPLLKHSVTAILTKECQIRDLHSAIKLAEGGSPYITPPIAQSLAKELCSARQAETNLSPRQKEIFGFLIRGAATSKIAEDLSLSSKTVSTHISRIKTRLGLSNNSEIIRYAIEHALICPNK